MEIVDFFDHESHTFTYLVYDSESKDALVIDPVINTKGIEDFLKSHTLNLKHILETHIHADHISGARSLKSNHSSAKLYISEKLEHVHNNFKSELKLDNFSVDKTGFDYFLKDQDIIPFGNSQLKVIATPGHTPACMCFLIENNLFTGDTMFMPDFGSGRCDFPGGSAQDLYDSIHQKLYKLPKDTNVFVGHDYGPGGREIDNTTTIGESMEHNIQIGVNISKNNFVLFRQKRDSVLSPPKGLLQNLKANLFGGLI